VSRFSAVVERLSAVIEARRGADPAESWTARLIADPQLAARKLAEEAVEAALALGAGDAPALSAEAADVVYHLLAALAAGGVTLDEVADELERREGRSGLEEKASRGV
jgi:phosphoribosyl-ATP pyrophosphohydrolase